MGTPRELLTPTHITTPSRRLKKDTTGEKTAKSLDKPCGSYIIHSVRLHCFVVGRKDWLRGRTLSELTPTPNYDPVEAERQRYEAFARGDTAHCWVLKATRAADDDPPA
jgi:hypothetical protein